MKKLLYYTTLPIYICLLISCQDEDVATDIVLFDSSVVKAAESFTDPRDNHTYPCIQIGNQIWMAENLCYQIPGNSFNGCYTWEESQATTDLNKVSSEDIPTIIEKSGVTNALFTQLVNEVATDPQYNGWTMYDTEFMTFLKAYPMFLIYLEYGMSQIYVLNLFKSSYPSFYQVLYSKYKVLVETRIANSPEAIVYIGNLHFEKAEQENNNYTSAYGFLYSYEGALTAVPEGWRLPTDEDWNTLESTLGMNHEEVQKKEAWRGSGMATLLSKGGESQFNAPKGGGNVYINAKSEEFMNKEKSWYYWSATQYKENDSTSVAMIRMSSNYTNKVWRGTSRINTGHRDVLYSVRCVKDAE